MVDLMHEDKIVIYVPFDSGATFYSVPVNRKQKAFLDSVFFD